jgi:hypothetical protein
LFDYRGEQGSRITPGGVQHFSQLCGREPRSVRMLRAEQSICI